MVTHEGSATYKGLWEGWGRGVGGNSTVMCTQLGAACRLGVRSAKRECFVCFQLFVDAFVVFFQVQERAV